MPITAAQRRALPPGAFAYPGRRSFPTPSRAQVAAANRRLPRGGRITERQRVGLHRGALSRAGQAATHGTPAHVRRHVAKRHGGVVASVSRTHTAAGVRRVRGTGRRR